MKDKKDMYFFTLDNITDYNGDEEESYEELCEKVKHNFELSENEENIEKVIMLLNNCIISLKKIDFKMPINEIYQIYGKIIKSCYSIGDMDSLLYYSNEFLEVFDKLDDDVKKESISYKIFVNTYLIAYYSDEDNNDKAIELFNDLTLCYNESKHSDFDKENYLRACSMIGMIYYNLKQFDKTLDLYNISKDISEELYEKGVSTYDNLAGNLFNISSVYYQLGEYEKAREVVIKNIETFNNKEFKTKNLLLSNCYNVLTLIYQKLEKYEDALEAFESLINTIKQDDCNDKTMLMCAYYNYRMGLIASKKLLDNDKAKVYYNNGLEYINKIENKTETCKKINNDIKAQLDSLE